MPACADFQQPKRLKVLFSSWPRDAEARHFVPQTKADYKPNDVHDSVRGLVSEFIGLLTPDTLDEIFQPHLWAAL